MSNKDSRTLVNDLISDEKVLSNDEMKSVEGGKNYYESRSNTNVNSTEAPPATTTPSPVTNVPTTPPTVPPVVPVDKKTQTPL